MSEEKTLSAVIGTYAPGYPSHVTADWLQDHDLQEADVRLIRGLYWFAQEWGMATVLEVAAKLSGRWFPGAHDHSPEPEGQVLLTGTEGEVVADFQNVLEQAAAAVAKHGVLLSISIQPIDDDEPEGRTFERDADGNVVSDG